MAADGIPRSYLTLHEKAPHVTHKILLTENTPFNGCLDGGATCCIANSRRLIQPGSERKINVTATLTDKSDMSFTEGGLISLRKRDGTVLTVLALLKEGAERTIISKGLLKDLGYCEIDDPAHPDVTNLWLDGKLQFSFPRRAPSVRLTSAQAMSAIHVSGLIEIPDNIFEIAMPRQEFQLTEYKPVDRSEPTVGLHSLHELHHSLAAQNKTDKLGLWTSWNPPLEHNFCGWQTPVFVLFAKTANSTFPDANHSKHAICCLTIHLVYYSQMTICCLAIHLFSRERRGQAKR